MTTDPVIEKAADLGLYAHEVVALQILADGGDDAAIAARLGRTENAARAVVRRASRRLGVSTRLHAVAAAMRKGLIE